MVTSLGHDVITSCTAARAGIVRSVELDYFPVCSPEDGSISGVIGHPVPLLTEGFEGDVRLFRLAQAGLADLLRQVPHAPWKQAKAAFYLSLPNPRRIYTGINLIPNEEERKDKQEEAKEAELEPIDENRAQHLLQNAAQMSGWQGEPELRFVATSGNTGIAEALHKAIEDLIARRIEVAIAGGVDSLLEEDTLSWLENTGRLKTPAIPAGLQPGEASAFIVLETLSGAKARQAKVLGIVQALHLGEEARTLLSGEPPIGRGLEELISGVAEIARWEVGKPVWFIADQNGETYRAMEWGNAIVRLNAKLKIFATPILWYPAISFGDTGAIGCALSICMALSAFDFGYAPDQKAMVVSSSDEILRSVVLITKS